MEGTYLIVLGDVLTLLCDRSMALLLTLAVDSWNRKNVKREFLWVAQAKWKLLFSGRGAVYSGRWAPTAAVVIRVDEYSYICMRRGSIFLKLRYIFTRLYDVTSQKVIFSVKTVNLNDMNNWKLITITPNYLTPWVGSFQRGASSDRRWRNGLQMCSVAANILNKQLLTADTWMSSSLGFAQGAKKSSP